MSLEERFDEFKDRVTDVVKEGNVPDQEAHKSISEVEKKAIEMGWSPDHKGEDFVSAKEFVSRGSFFKKIDSQNKKIDDLMMTVKELARHNAKIEEISYKKGLEDAVKRKVEAVAAGDLRAFEQAEREVFEIQSTMPAPKPNSLSKESQEFIDKNLYWFNDETPENKAMKAFAISFGDSLQKIDPSRSDLELLTDVKEAVALKFPHKFKNEKKSAPASVDTSSASRSGSKLPGLAARLTPQQQFIFKKCKELDSRLSIEEYAKRLDMTGDLKDE